MELKNKKVLIVGAAVTGIPVVRLLSEMGAKVILNDRKDASEISEMLESLKNINLKYVGGGHPAELADEADVIVMSPGVPLDIPVVKKANELNKEVISEIELSYRLIDTPIVCITGTNGKTTTTALLGEIMKASGRKTFVTGNIGHTMISEVKNARPEDIFVLEASSFQLECTKLFRPKVAAILNITPDHLDRHKTMDNYIAAKCKVFENQTSEDYLILNKDNSETAILGNSAKSKVLFFSRREVLEEGAFLENNNIVISINGEKHNIINKDDIFIPGAHNIENSLAAALMAFCLGVDGEIIAGILREFKGVEHRVEYVAEINGVRYYNDSKGTNVDSSIKGIESMTRPTVLIAGGYDKGSEFHDFIAVFGDVIKDMVLIGKTTDKIEKTAHEMGFLNTHRASSLEEAVKMCAELAKPGYNVLLSPACASWDMFKNFEERGNLFKSLVLGLRGTE
ncbi:MAG: UDP-N-acetylmuramoyl-L-alanine--D-glutamate ligase [Bacillota bacterium]